MKKVICLIVAVLVIGTAISVYMLNRLGGRIIDEVIESEISKSIDQQLEDSVPQNVDKKSSEHYKSGEVPYSVEQKQVYEPADINKTQSEQPNLGSTTKVPSKSSQPIKQNDNSPKTYEKIKISTNKIQEVKDQVTFSDKMTAATMALKRLSTSDIDELKGMLSNGISADEKEKAKQLVYQRFTDKEVKEIKEIYYKYMKKKATN